MWQLLGEPLEEQCYPQTPLFCSDGTFRTGLHVSNCFLVHTHGAAESTAVPRCWHVPSFQCGKAKTFGNRHYWDQWDNRLKALLVQLPRDVGNLPLLPSEKGTDCPESTGAMIYLHHAQAAPAFSQTLGKKQTELKYPCISERAAAQLFCHALAALQVINARILHGCPSTPGAETLVFTQEGPWPNSFC